MDKPFDLPEQVLCLVSVFSGMVMCKIVSDGTTPFFSFLSKVYEVTGFISSLFFDGYTKLGRMEKIEWNNRGFSSFHAVVVATVSFYLLVLTELFKDDYSQEPVTERASFISNSLFGISIGYFLSDLAMILWLFPALGGKEYILHHGISLSSITLALVTGSAHFYILMVLFSEITTPFVNLRWYLDRSGQKNSKLYLYNGVALFLGWLVARILLFVVFYIHVYLHFDQVKTMFTLGFYNLLIAPSIVTVMNIFWFWKIVKGLIKTVSKSKHKQ